MPESNSGRVITQGEEDYARARKARDEELARAAEAVVRAARPGFPLTAQVAIVMMALVPVSLFVAGGVGDHVELHSIVASTVVIVALSATVVPLFATIRSERARSTVIEQELLRAHAALHQAARQTASATLEARVRDLASREPQLLGPSPLSSFSAAVEEPEHHEAVQSTTRR